MSAAAVKVSNPMFNPAASPRADTDGAEEAEEDGADSSVEQKMAKYEEIFQRYDEDNSGTIEASELQNVMRELGQDMSPDELAAMIKEIDTDGSGEIDFEEFMQAVTGKMSAIFADMNKELEDKIFGSSATREKGTALQADGPSLGECYGILHPLSGRRKYYDLFQVTLLMWTLYYVPLRIAFAYEPSTWSLAFCLDLSVDFFFFLDMFVQMHTFYLSGRTGQWVNNRTKVRARYFRSWFLVDFVAVFPADYIVRAMHWSGTGGDARSFRMLRLARILRYARLLKLLNLKRLDAIVEEYQKKIGFSAMTVDFAVKLFGMILGLFAFNHLTACIWIFVGREHSQYIEPYGVGDGWWDRQFGDRLVMGHSIDERDQYVDAVYFVMMTVTSIGYGDITTGNLDEKHFLYIMMFGTAFTYAYMIGVFADIVSTRRSDRNLFDMKMRSVFEFLNHVDCPKELMTDIKLFYNHRYPRKTLFDEKTIYSELPPKFMKRLVLHRFERTVHYVPFFRSCSDECIVAICRKFHGFMATPEDLILERGETNKELVIMEHGEATGDDGAGIVTDYKAGSFFGEMEFLGLQEVSPITVKALTYCDLYGLKLVHIRHTMTEYPDFAQKLTQYANLRRKAMASLMGDGPAEPGSPTMEKEVHNPALTVAEGLKTASRSRLEAVILAAVVGEKLELADLTDILE